MNIDEVVACLKKRLEESPEFMAELRSDKKSYSPDKAAKIFERWLRYSDANRRLNHVYGPNLPETIIKINKILHAPDFDLASFQKTFRGFAFLVGPRSVELCASAVTPCGSKCCSNR